MRQIKQKIIQADEQAKINKENLHKNISKLKADFTSWLRSPRTLGGTFLVGFLMTYRGRARKHVMNFTKRHVLGAHPFVAAPILGKILQFVPFILAFRRRNRKNNKSS